MSINSYVWLKHLARWISAWFSTVVTLFLTEQVISWGRSFEIRPTSPQNFVRQFSIQQFSCLWHLLLWYLPTVILYFPLFKNLLVGILLWEETVSSLITQLFINIKNHFCYIVLVRREWLESVLKRKRLHNGINSKRRVNRTLFKLPKCQIFL